MAGRSPGDGPLLAEEGWRDAPGWSGLRDARDDLATSSAPDCRVPDDVTQRGVERADAKRLADEEGMEVEDQQPAALFAVLVQHVEALADHAAVAVEIHPALP